MKLILRRRRLLRFNRRRCCTKLYTMHRRMRLVLIPIMNGTISWLSVLLCFHSKCSTLLLHALSYLHNLQNLGGSNTMARQLLVLSVIPWFHSLQRFQHLQQKNHNISLQRKIDDVYGAHVPTYIPSANVASLCSSIVLVSNNSWIHHVIRSQDIVTMRRDSRSIDYLSPWNCEQLYYHPVLFYSLFTSDRFNNATIFVLVPQLRVVLHRSIVTNIASSVSSTAHSKPDQTGWPTCLNITI